MNAPHVAYKAKINPTSHAIALKPDNTPDDNDRVEIGPTALAFDEWKQAGLDCPDLQAMRQFRWQRMTNQIQKRELAGLLMFDPLNIRYATDSTDMQLWNAHNPFRACLLLANGHMVLWEYGGLDMLSAFNPLVKEVRRGSSFFYFTTGPRTEEKARQFVADVDSLLREHVGDNRRLAVDKIQIAGLRALDAAGIIVEDGEEVAETTRSVKGPDEIKAMRCAIHACAQSIAAMRRAVAPGQSENAVWAELHRENILRGGEWIETRLLSTGPRTNPWMQECGPRIMHDKEILAFDTDLVGCYGMCVDISRTWLVGDGKPSDEQKRLHGFALDHIHTNMALFKPGASLREIGEKAHDLTDEFTERRYLALAHGVGLCDEWPSVKYKIDYENSGYDGLLEPGMMICVEAYFGAVGGKEGVKLEEQILITENGCENLSASIPFDERFLA